MLKSSLAILATLATTGAFAASAQAAFVLQDDFSGHTVGGTIQGTNNWEQQTFGGAGASTNVTADGIFDLGGDNGKAAGLGSGGVEYERDFTNGDDVPVSGTGTLFLQLRAETTNNFVTLGVTPANPTSTSLATPFRFSGGSIFVGQDDGTGFDDTGFDYAADTTYSVWLVANNRPTPSTPTSRAARS